MVKCCIITLKTCNTNFDENRSATLQRIDGLAGKPGLVLKFFFRYRIFFYFKNFHRRCWFLANLAKIENLVFVFPINEFSFFLIFKLLAKSQKKTSCPIAGCCLHKTKNFAKPS